MRRLLTVLLFLTTFPLFAEDKVVEKTPGKPKVVSIGGQVARPGTMECRENTTIYSIIFAAGGLTEFGTLKRVKVYRGGMQLQFDLTKEKAKNGEFVKPDDIIEVPQKNLNGG